MSNNSSIDRAFVLDYFRRVGARASLANRRANPFFRGRDPELDLLHANVACAVGGERDNRTATICGAPGAGKSELMLKFMDQLRPTHGSNVVQVHARHTDLSHAPALMRTLLGSLPSKRRFSVAARKFKRDLGEFTSLSVGTGFARSERRGEPETTGQAAHVDWFREYVAKLPKSVRECVFVLCVDEFQNLKNPSQSLCEPLHDAGLVLKIVPFYFGLANVPSVLDASGVKRTLDEITISLGALTIPMAESILKDFLDSLRVRYASDVDCFQLVSEVARRCDAWPQHLTSWMQAACNVLSSCEFVLSRQSRDKINDKCDQVRVDYYERSLDRCRFLDSPTRRRTLGRLLEDRQAVSAENIQDSMTPLFKQSSTRFDITHFLDDAIRSGVLIKQPGGTLSVPIPSLANYLMGS